MISFTWQDTQTPGAGRLVIQTCRNMLLCWKGLEHQCASLPSLCWASIIISTKQSTWTSMSSKFFLLDMAWSHNEIILQGGYRPEEVAGSLSAERARKNIVVWSCKYQAGCMLLSLHPSRSIMSLRMCKCACPSYLLTMLQCFSLITGAESCSGKFHRHVWNPWR